MKKITLVIASLFMLIGSVAAQTIRSTENDRTLTLKDLDFRGKEKYSYYEDKEGNYVKHGTYIFSSNDNNFWGKGVATATKTVKYEHGLPNGPFKSTFVAKYPGYSFSETITGNYVKGKRNGVWTSVCNGKTHTSKYIMGIVASDVAVDSEGRPYGVRKWERWGRNFEQTFKNGVLLNQTEREKGKLLSQFDEDRKKVSLVYASNRNEKEANKCGYMIQEDNFGGRVYEADNLNCPLSSYDVFADDEIELKVPFFEYLSPFPKGFFDGYIEEGDYYKDDNDYYIKRGNQNIYIPVVLVEQIKELEQIRLNNYISGLDCFEYKINDGKYFVCLGCSDYEITKDDANKLEQKRKKQVEDLISLNILNYELQGGEYYLLYSRNNQSKKVKITADEKVKVDEKNEALRTETVAKAINSSEELKCVNKNGDFYLLYNGKEYKLTADEKVKVDEKNQEVALKTQLKNAQKEVEKLMDWLMEFNEKSYNYYYNGTQLTHYSYSDFEGIYKKYCPIVKYKVLDVDFVEESKLNVYISYERQGFWGSVTEYFDRISVDFSKLNEIRLSYNKSQTSSTSESIKTFCVLDGNPYTEKDARTMVKTSIKEGKYLYIIKGKDAFMNIGNSRVKLLPEEVSTINELSKTLVLKQASADIKLLQKTKKELANDNEKDYLPIKSFTVLGTQVDMVKGVAEVKYSFVKLIDKKTMENYESVLYYNYKKGIKGAEFELDKVKSFDFSRVTKK